MTFDRLKDGIDMIETILKEKDIKLEDVIVNVQDITVGEEEKTVHSLNLYPLRKSPTVVISNDW